ncbi:hypothetical protein EEB15_30075 [Ramlibacter sp. WS9]|nr:hypothetical protein EEB15_30075 [Ramlibacter sp. WS9]
MDLTMLLDTDAALRRCALTLHAMGPKDRQWLLANLPQDRRAELERLVGELQALGIPADPRATDDALKRNRSARVAPAATPDWTAQARSADAAELARVLQYEPAALIAHVIGLRAEPPDEVLGHLGVSKRRQVQELLPAAHRRHPAAVAPALSQALLEQISLRLVETGPARPAVTGWRSRWPGLARVVA